MNAARFVSRLTRKSRSNFFYAFLLLPRAQRDAIFAVYAFCRIVDDAVDEGVDRAAQRQELARWRGEIARIWGEEPTTHPAGGAAARGGAALSHSPGGARGDHRGGGDGPRSRRLRDLRGPLPVLLPGGLRGGPVQHRDLRIHGSSAQDYAINLGVALQLTNILRDVQTDARMGRVYLPQEDLRRFGVTGEDLREGRYTPAFVELMAFEAARARDYYARAWRGLPAVDRRTLFAAEIMGHTYFALLRAIEARRFDVFGERVAVPTRRRVAIALAGWAAPASAPGAAPRSPAPPASPCAPPSISARAASSRAAARRWRASSPNVFPSLASPRPSSSCAGRKR